MSVELCGLCQRDNSRIAQLGDPECLDAIQPNKETSLSLMLVPELSTYCTDDLQYIPFDLSCQRVFLAHAPHIPGSNYDHFSHYRVHLYG